ncbi:MAG TPA: alpha/beta hydrolase, partial [Rhodanobacteraceae bacterium]|nr:alpha/beta hydrolase [Rhodanobacteraceae bacterium]
DCVGLFLIALPVAIPGYPRRFGAVSVPTALVHGWDDEICPVDDAIAFARERGDAITLVRDDHRLSAHVDFVATQFREFLGKFA